MVSASVGRTARSLLSGIGSLVRGGSTVPLPQGRASRNCLLLDGPNTARRGPLRLKALSSQVKLGLPTHAPSSPDHTSYTLLRLRALANLRQNLLHVDLASIRGLKLDGDANELQTACACHVVGYSTRILHVIERHGARWRCKRCRRHVRDLQHELSRGGWRQMCWRLNGRRTDFLKFSLLAA
jgi:hypothetical protein